MKKTLSLLLLILSAQSLAGVSSFDETKQLLRRRVFQTDTDRTFYCGCKWEWAGKTGGRVNLGSCGYVPRKNQARAERIEWEHVVPAWVFGHQRQCWQAGGRKNCAANDAVYRAMEADPYNLRVAIGEVNGDRSNFSFGMLPKMAPQYGACDIKIDLKQKMVEPRDEIKGQIARTYFYMHKRYNLSMSKQQEQLFSAWNKQFPPTPSEEARNKKIAELVGWEFK